MSGLRLEMLSWLLCGAANGRRDKQKKIAQTWIPTMYQAVPPLCGSGVLVRAFFLSLRRSPRNHEAGLSERIASRISCFGALGKPQYRGSGAAPWATRSPRCPASIRSPTTTRVAEFCLELIALMEPLVLFTRDSREEYKENLERIKHPKEAEAASGGGSDLFIVSSRFGKRTCQHTSVRT